MGDMGTMIGWPMMLGLSLIVSNAVAVVTGEWKGMGGPLKLMLLGVFVIIVATVVMAYASTLKPEDGQLKAQVRRGSDAMRLHDRGGLISGEAQHKKYP